MARLVCTRRLENIGPCEPTNYNCGTVEQLIDTLAADYPRLKNYVLDDQGRVRQHVAIFVDGTLLPRHAVLQSPLSDNSEVYIMQALSGG